MLYSVAGKANFPVMGSLYRALGLGIRFRPFERGMEYMTRF